LEIRVNGRIFLLARMKNGEGRTLDASSAMFPGDRNVVEVTAFGKPGTSATLVIHD
jgi:hypothetical protein